MERALDRLREALAVPADAPLAIDGTIQHYEFSIKLTWKTLKCALSNEGIETATPREAIVQGFKVHWIDDESMRLRNFTMRRLRGKSTTEFEDIVR